METTNRNGHLGRDTVRRFSTGADWRKPHAPCTPSPAPTWLLCGTTGKSVLRSLFSEHLPTKALDGLRAALPCAPSTHPLARRQGRPVPHLWSQTPLLTQLPPPLPPPAADLSVRPRSWFVVACPGWGGGVFYSRNTCIPNTHSSIGHSPTLPAGLRGPWSSPAAQEKPAPDRRVGRAGRCINVDAGKLPLRMTASLQEDMKTTDRSHAKINQSRRYAKLGKQ